MKNSIINVTALFLSNTQQFKFKITCPFTLMFRSAHAPPIHHKWVCMRGGGRGARARETGEVGKRGGGGRLGKLESERGGTRERGEKARETGEGGLSLIHI